MLNHIHIYIYIYIKKIAPYSCYLDGMVDCELGSRYPFVLTSEQRCVRQTSAHPPNQPFHPGHRAITSSVTTYANKSFYIINMKSYNSYSGCNLSVTDILWNSLQFRLQFLPKMINDYYHFSSKLFLNCIWRITFYFSLTTAEQATDSDI